MVGWSMSAKRNDEHTHKCDDWTEEYLVWKQEIVRQPEVIYISYMFILAWPSERKDCNYVIIKLLCFSPRSDNGQAQSKL